MENSNNSVQLNTLLSNNVNNNMGIEELKERLVILEHQDNIQNNLECCCFSGRVSDKRLVILSAQIFFSATVVFFSFFKLSTDDVDNDQSRAFLPLITSILSYWMGRNVGNSVDKN